MHSVTDCSDQYPAAREKQFTVGIPAGNHTSVIAYSTRSYINMFPIDVKLKFSLSLD
jgi:hypothetical protein